MSVLTGNSRVVDLRDVRNLCQARKGDIVHGLIDFAMTIDSESILALLERT